MTLPGFLGIGAQRSGTTWLDHRLRSHPQIYLPTLRKEVHFFDEYYDRGLAWYGRFFPSAEKALAYRAIGEITPKYLYAPEAPARIRECLPGCKLIAILRNPADRAYSQYGLSVKNAGESRFFEDFLAVRPEAFQRGLYGRQVGRFLDCFPRKDLLVLIFERDVTRDQHSALEQIADFLQVEAGGFGTHDVGKPVGGSHRTRFPRARAAASEVAQFLRRNDFDPLVNFAKATGLPQIFGNRGPISPMDAATRTELLEKYESDIVVLEKLLGEDLTVWRDARVECGMRNAECGKDSHV